MKGSGIGTKLKQGSLFYNKTKSVPVTQAFCESKRARRRGTSIASLYGKRMGRYPRKDSAEALSEFYGTWALMEEKNCIERGLSLEISIHENERLDDLQYQGLRLLQKKDGFCFGVDAVLLSHFAQVSKEDSVIDLGTGTGIIAILLSAKKQPRKVTGIEIQADMADMAARSVRLNHLEDRVEIVEGDIRDTVKRFGASSFDAVVSNPPYMEKGAGLLNPGDAKAIARHEILCTLDDVISSAARLLRPGGKLSMVHRPQRMTDILYLMRKYAIEPKWMRLVHPMPGKKPNLLLISGTKNGNPELKVQEPLYIYDEIGHYSSEIDEIYNDVITTL